jgi:tetratricopeptide (TPR) repeat protein
VSCLSSFKDKKKNKGYKGNSAGKRQKNASQLKGVKSDASKPASKGGAPKSGAPSRSRDNSLAKKIGITVVCLLLVIALMIPSLFSIIGSHNAGVANSAQQETVESVNSRYQGTADAVLAKVNEDPDNTSYLQNLVTVYDEWGSQLMSVASADGTVSDEETQQISNCFDNVVTYADRYIEAGGDSQDVQVDRAMAYHYLGDDDKAISNMKRLCRNDSDNASLWQQLGALCQATGDTDGAADAYGKAVDITKAACESDPTNWQGWYSLGMLYQQMGDKDQAKDAYGKAIENCSDENTKATLNQIVSGLSS